MSAWTFKRRNLNHCNHTLEANPFMYPEHKHLHPGDALAVAAAIKDREGGVTYERHIRNKDPEARLMTKSEYYNYGYDCHSVNDNSPTNVINRMLKALEEAGFHVRTRWTTVYEGSQKTERLDQIFFVSDAQVTKAQRFCSEFILQMDTTFSTNQLGMPLANIVGVDNHMRTFTLALSFVRAEHLEDFKFILQCLEELVFYETPLPRVVLSDQAAGLQKALAESSRWNSVYHQLCVWHMVSNIKAKVRNNRVYEAAKDLDEVWDAVWQHVQNDNSDTLNTTRDRMYALLKPSEKEYYSNNWVAGGKETRVLRAYTKLHPNLGLRSTSRNEGQNRVLKKFINNTMNLEQATRQLIRTLAQQDSLDEQLDAQSRLKKNQPTALGMKGLLHLEGLITREAIDRLKSQMHKALQGYVLFEPPMPLVRDGPGGTYSCVHLCENPVQFGLPCWHIMQSHLRQTDNAPLPANFVHPRWFITSQPEAAADSSGNTPSPSPDTTSGRTTVSAGPRPVHYLTGSGEMLLTKTAIEAEAFRAQLGSEDAERYALQFHQVEQDLRRDFIPMPSGRSTKTPLAFVPRPKLTKHQEELRKKAIGRKMSRLLTSDELAEIDANKRMRELKRKAAQATVPSSSAPAALASSSHRDQPPPRKKRASARQPAVPEWMRDSTTQDMDAWELQWNRERLADQGVLLDSSSEEEEEDGDADSLDLCEINTQDQALLEGYDSRGPQGEGMAGDTQETAIEID
jgi:hypothetical protein